MHHTLVFCIRMGSADWATKDGVLAGVCRCRFTVVRCAGMLLHGAGSSLLDENKTMVRDEMA